MSRAKEIQEKLDLQAKLQLAFGNRNAKVASWLDGSDDKSNEIEKKNYNEDMKYLNESKKQFFELPVVQIGSGLSFQSIENDSNTADDIHTVGEFIESNKKISSLGKKKKRSDQTGHRDIYRVAKDDTKAMVALKRKMRQGKRESIKRNISEVSSSNSKLKPHNNTSQNENHSNATSDDDDEPRVEKSVKKKAFGLLFSKKKK